MGGENAYLYFELFKALTVPKNEAQNNYPLDLSWCVALSNDTPIPKYCGKSIIDRSIIHRKV